MSLLFQYLSENISLISWALNLGAFSLIHNPLQVDLTEYEEKHEFVFDAVLDEDVSNDEVSLLETCSLSCFASVDLTLSLILLVRYTLRVWSP